MDVSIEEFEDQMMAFFEAPQARSFKLVIGNGQLWSPVSSVNYGAWREGGSRRAPKIPRLLLCPKWSWGWTGVNNLGKKLVVRRLLMERKRGVDCGLKKINHWGSWSSPCVEWKAHAAVGAAECVLLMWDKRVVEKIEVAIGVFSVFCLYPNGEVWFLWALNVVYGSNDNKLRVGLQ